MPKWALPHPHTYYPPPVGKYNGQNKKERIDMMKHNDSIGCTVTECSYHCKEDNYCTLNKIDVVKNKPAADTVECTDCGSFRKS